MNLIESDIDSDVPLFEIIHDFKHQTNKLKHINLGLCCINTKLRNLKPPVFCSRTMTIKSIQTKGIDELKLRIIQNIKDLKKMIEWNELHGIKVLRISSGLFPHKSNPRVQQYSYDFALKYLKEAGELAKKYNHRLTFHPGQYNVVGTPHDHVFKNTIEDLKYHADVLDLLNVGKDGVIVVHGGGTYGDKQTTIKRWCDNFKKLPQNVQNRLVLENCEKSYSIEDCLYISSVVNIPVVFDTHHYECYKILHPSETLHDPSYYIPHILKTWSKRSIKPKFHVSEQGPGRTGHHSDYIKKIPRYLLEIPEKYGQDIDIMIEAKMKEQAIFRLHKKYRVTKDTL